MTSRPSWTEGVWTSLDREFLVKTAARVPQTLFATISGAHLYGFSSPDSDVDLRGAFVLPHHDVLGLRKPEETVTIEEDADIELDFVAHDLRKFARMMIQHNGYVLEQLFSPLVVVGGPLHDELCRIGEGCVTREIYRHYRGFALGQRKLLEEKATVKQLLYAYRVYMSGIHVLREGTIEANINVLNPEFRLSHVSDLVERKAAGKEKGLLDEGEAEQHRIYLDQLAQQLDEEYERSVLPAEPTTWAALNDFVIRVRVTGPQT